MYTLGNLIEELQMIADNWGEDVEVRLAMQPSWPFEYSIASVIEIKETDDYDDDDYSPFDKRDDETDEEYFERIEELENAPTVVYLSEGRQIGYLPGNVKNELGW